MIAARILTASVTVLALVGGSLQPSLARAEAPAAAPAQPVAAQPVAQPVTAQPAAQPVTAQPTAQPVAAQPAAQPVAAQPAAQPPVAQPPVAQPAPTAWDDEPVASPPPPRVTPATAPAPTDLQPPPPRDRTGSGLVIGGVTLVAVGASALLFVAAPAAIAKRVALDRAERDHALGFSTSRERYQRARSADNTMEGAFWVGISALALGTVLAITGGVVKSRARQRAMARVASSPGGLAIRF